MRSASRDLELHPNVTGDFVEPGVGCARALRSGRRRYRLAARRARAFGAKIFRTVSLAAHADGGVVLGDDPPPQKLFELGGNEALPGYRYKEFAGDRAALFRTFASYRFDSGVEPIEIFRNFFVPGLSPGIARASQGGWTELSSPGAAQPFALGVKRTVCRCPTATDGVRATAGGGFTLFSDLLHLGVARPVDHSAPWRFVVGFGGALLGESR